MIVDDDDDDDDDDTDYSIEVLNEITYKLLDEISFRFDSNNMKILKAFEASNPFSENFMDKKDLSPVFENYKDYFNDLFFTVLQVTKNW
jgi:hypothetical protein